MLIIKDALIVDPSQPGEPKTEDLFIQNTLIIDRPAEIPPDAQIIDAKGCWVTPGLIDIHCHLRDPGFPTKETIASGTSSAAAGGFTTICPMANTKPTVDSHVVLEYVKAKTAQEGLTRVLQHAALTIGLAGQELVEMTKLYKAGAVAFSDDGVPYDNLGLFKIGLQNAAHLGAVVVSHAEDSSLFAGGAMHDGEWSLRLGLRGIPSEAESVAVAREIEVLRGVPNAHLHFSHISTAQSVELIRRAKNDGLRVTAETTPHHIFLDHSATQGHNTAAKMNPPLRTEEDRCAVINGVLDGTLDALATDHAPHTEAEKSRPFADAPFGITGFETALAIYLQQLHNSGLLQPKELIARLTTRAAACLELKFTPSLKVGSNADVTIIDPNLAWTFMRQDTASKSFNSPFYGYKFRGRATHTILGGKVSWKLTNYG